MDTTRSTYLYLMSLIAIRQVEINNIVEVQKKFE